MTPGRLSRPRKFTPVPSSRLYICLHDTTTKCHPGVSSPRLLYLAENFTSVRNLATESCKHESTTRFGLKLVCRLTGTGRAFVMFAILNHTCILSVCGVRDMKWPCHHVNAIRNQKVIPVCKRALVRVFSCKHPLKEKLAAEINLYMFSCYIDLNECSRDKYYCHRFATCSNNRGSFTCTCDLQQGFIGDGFECNLNYAGWCSYVGLV